jgi:hypothetical protein
MTIGKAACLIPIIALGLLASPVARAASHDEDALKQMQEHKLTLAKAVETAETACKGTAIGTHIKMSGKDAQLIVHCAVGDKCMLVPVDVKTGKAEKATEATPVEEKEDHTGKAKDITKALDTEKASVVSAITAVEKSHGKATSVMSKLEGGKLEFAVRVVDNGKVSTVTVDAKGNVVKADEAKKAEPKKVEPKKVEPKKPEPKKP